MDMQGSFAFRVRVLRDSWREQRQVERYATAYDVESQFQLLGLLYDWAAASVRAISDSYGESFPIALTQPLGRQEPAPRFSVLVTGREVLTFHLVEQQGVGLPHWHVAMSSRGVVSKVRGPWTRAHVEDRLLALVAEHERAQLAGIRLSPESSPTGPVLYGYTGNIAVPAPVDAVEGGPAIVRRQRGRPRRLVPPASDGLKSASPLGA
jgi:hypothetical protein